MNSVGWRVGPLIVGTLLVLVLTRLVRRVSRSTLIGGLAGLLLALDGLALRDVADRAARHLPGLLRGRRRGLPGRRPGLVPQPAGRPPGAHTASTDLGGRFGPALIVRPWRIAAGVCFGLALGSKWNALYVLAAFALLSLAWDVGARRLAGAGPGRLHAGSLRDGIPAFVSLVLLAAVVYVEHLGQLAGQHRVVTTATGAPSTRTPGRSGFSATAWPR